MCAKKESETSIALELPNSDHVLFQYFIYISIPDLSIYFLFWNQTTILDREK
ncbi:2200_t:CDS:1, partial [Gigaspora rosea]